MFQTQDEENLRFLIRHFCGSPRAISDHRWYTLITSSYAHFSTFHLIGNVLGIYVFGLPVRKRFYLFFLSHHRSLFPLLSHVYKARGDHRSEAVHVDLHSRRDRVQLGAHIIFGVFGVERSFAHAARSAVECASVGSKVSFFSFYIYFALRALIINVYLFFFSFRLSAAL